jgi:hypothetical protein
MAPGEPTSARSRREGTPGLAVAFALRPLESGIRKTMSDAKTANRMMWGVAVTLAGLVFFCVIPGVFGVRAAFVGLLVYICMAIVSFKLTAARLE